jgi:type I restriction-modification system DNA methylase subunit
VKPRWKTVEFGARRKHSPFQMAQPPPQVLELIQRFDRNREAYRSPQYNETQLRREFLDPFFKALGWDIDNEQGYAEAYKDVFHEDAIKVGEGTKAPDYCFRIGGTRKFFLEAKRPSVDIKDDVSPAFQLRRYGWTVKLSLSVLSDFEEFAVYDCRLKPVHQHSAAIGRILYIPYTEYARRWDEIAGVFSRDAVLKGSFDKFAESNKAKGATEEVDEDFLKTIETWRADLARNIALRNPKLSQRELNFAVQRIIDRIIFLRISEGRGIEDAGRLRALTNGDRIYPRLCQVFEEADTRYNSGLFHFKPEKDRHEAPDELTLGLDIDDKLLRDIIKSLYYPESPCVFAALPADILGQVYEQFLGKVIRLTEGHRAVVDDKPEVKKAGGVYYTPTYVVDYIVQTTVGHLLEGKTPKQAAKLKVLDPACGSGSFLIGAYQHLLDWHHDFYTKHDPAKWAKGPRPVLVQVGAGNWKLTIAERKRILLDNIFGVDIDSQAVETTKLSLLLKVLEGETQQSLQPVLRFFHERALPDLGDNIKCGNSLIGPDFYRQQEMPLLDEEARYRVNVFDWQAEFPQILRRKTASGELHETPAAPLDYTWPGVPLHGSFSYKKMKGEKTVPAPAPLASEWEGGFDAVIGNPPYVRIQGFPADQVQYLTTHYRSATGNCDLYVSFIERSLNLLNQGGTLGLITPNKFFRTEYGKGLRSLLSNRRAVRRIVDFGANQVFTATTYTCLLFLQKSASETFEYAKRKADPASLKNAAFSRRDSNALGSNSWTFESRETASLLAKLEKDTTRLLDLPADMGRGSSTGDDNVFVLETGSLSIEEGLVREPLFASDFGRYSFAPSGKWSVIFPYHIGKDGAYRLYSEQELKTKFPRAFAYLHENQPALRRRKQYREWFGYSAPRNLELHDQAKIAVPLLADRGLCAWIRETKRGSLCPMASGGFTITIAKESPLNAAYVLGLLNSKLLFWRLGTLSNVFRGGWITCTKQYFGELPIRKIDFSVSADKSRHDQVVRLVELMLALHQRLSAAKTPQEKTALERQITANDTQIDRLVYELYGLTEAEIKIVEGATAC